MISSGKIADSTGRLRLTADMDNIYSPQIRVVDINTGISGIRFSSGKFCSEIYEVNAELLFHYMEDGELEKLYMTAQFSTSEEFYADLKSQLTSLEYEVTNVPALQEWIK